LAGFEEPEREDEDVAGGERRAHEHCGRYAVRHLDVDLEVGEAGSDRWERARGVETDGWGRREADSRWIGGGDGWCEGGKQC